MWLHDPLGVRPNEECAGVGKRVCGEGFLLPKCPSSGDSPQSVRDEFLHRGFCTSETRIWGRILGNRILGARILDPNSWVKFFDSVFFQQKRPPEKFTLEKFTSQNSPSKIQPRNRAKKFTLHLCRAIWLTKCGKQGGSDRYVEILEILEIREEILSAKRPLS